MNICKIYGKASYTIEAALIMPIIMFIIAAILFSCIYLRDMLTIKTSMYSFVLNNSQNEIEELAEQLTKQLCNDLVCTKILEMKIDNRDEEIKIDAVYKFGNPLKVIKDLLLINNNGIKVEKINVSNLHKSDFIRKCKVAEDLKSMAGE